MASPAETETFHNQFVLAKSPPAAPADWPRRTLTGYHLATHPALPVIELRANDADVGWLIGHAIDRGGHLVTNGWSRRLLRSRSLSGTAEDFVATLGGRFACVVLTPTVARLYLDAAGSLAAVYATGRPAVASTPSFLAYADRDAYVARMSGVPVLEPNQFYPAGLTAEPDVRRLLPNHYLDLDAWRPVRYWPTAPIERGSDADVPDLVARIIERLSDNVAGVAERYPLHIGLSAGRDSRMVLAAARGALDRATFVTFDYPDAEKHGDTPVARRLAGQFGLRHAMLLLDSITDEQKARYLYRTGYVGHWGKARDFDAALGRHLDPGGAWLTGFGGEVGRAFYWGRDKPLTHTPSAEDILRRMKLPISDTNRDAMRAWVDGTGIDDPYTLLDLAYLELRLGCWACPHMYGTAPLAANLTPFAHREIFDAMLRLPIDYRRHEKLAEGVIAASWPELLSVPFKRFETMGDVVRRVRARLGRVKRRLRSTLLGGPAGNDGPARG